MVTEAENCACRDGATCTCEIFECTCECECETCDDELEITSDCPCGGNCGCSEEDEILPNTDSFKDTE